MQRYLAALTIVLLAAMILIRGLLLRRQGTRSMHLEKADLIFVPFAGLYVYLAFANAFALRGGTKRWYFSSETLSWIGIAFCIAGLLLLLSALMSFGRSFRIGIDKGHSQKLVTTGIFGITRNPIYMAFSAILLGQFLVFPNWMMLVYLAAAIPLFHRQVLREEVFLKERYGKEYWDYCRHVRRYI